MQGKTFEQECNDWEQAFKDCKNLAELERLQHGFTHFRNLGVLRGQFMGWQTLKPIMQAYKQQKQILTNL